MKAKLFTLLNKMQFNLQNEMTFECFCMIPYPKKLQRCNIAFQSLSKRQIKVNKLLNVFRHQRKMQEIFDNLLQLNSLLCQTCVNLFKADIFSKHEYYGLKCNPNRLASVSNDIINLLHYMSIIPKTDSDMDVLFLTAHSIKDSQIRFWKHYHVHYNWGEIFSSKTPCVSINSVHSKFDYKFLMSKELKAKYKQKLN